MHAADTDVTLRDAFLLAMTSRMSAWRASVKPTDNANAQNHRVTSVIQELDTV